MRSPGRSFRFKIEYQADILSVSEGTVHSVARITSKRRTKIENLIQSPRPEGHTAFFYTFKGTPLTNVL